MNQEKRTYTRVGTRLRAMLRRMESVDEPAMFHGHGGGQNAAAHSEALRGALPDEVAEFMLTLDRKVDSLIAMMGREAMEADFPIPATVVELSGSGLTFLSEEPFGNGDFVEAVIVLSRMPLVLAGAQGRIRKAAEQGENHYGLEFISIREADLEAVIQFVFGEERARIRQQKWS